MAFWKDTGNTSSHLQQSVQILQQTDKSSKTTFILIAVIVVLVVSNSIFVYVFLSIKRRYKRKLLAATINSQDKGIEMQTTSMAVPGSNKYMSQSNPLLNMDIDEQSQPQYDALSVNSQNSLDSNEVDHAKEEREYDKIEEKEVTLDMYTDDILPESLEGESPLDAALRLHEKSKQATQQEDTVDEEVEPMQFINNSYAEELESSEI